MTMELEGLYKTIKAIEDPKIREKTINACEKLASFVRDKRHGNIIFSVKDGTIADKYREETIGSLEP